MPFREPREVFGEITEGRFALLEGFAAEHGPSLDLAEEAKELGLDLATCLAAVATPCTDVGLLEAAFAPFEGEWIGGDIHDSRRVYRHVWHPTDPVIDGFAGQKVLMLDTDGRETLAYDFFEERSPRGEPRLTGLVGDRAHLGFLLPEGALLWLGEERDGQVSVHLERVRAEGQLYDIRGVVAAGAKIRARSDWRYHRLRPGAVSAHH